MSCFHTGFTPYELLYGRQPRTPVDAAFKLDAGLEAPMTQQILRNIVAKEAQAKYQQRYDAKHVNRQFNIGDFVWYNTVRKPEFRGSSKFEPKLHGPYIIEDIKGPRTYVIRNFRDSRTFRHAADYEREKELAMQKRSEVLTEELRRRVHIAQSAQTSASRGRETMSGGVMSEYKPP